MKTSELDYHLPLGQIAQASVHPRDTSKLLVVDGATGALQHKLFRNVIDRLQPSDVLVFNNTKVFRARLRATTENNFSVEVFLLHPEAGGWICIGKPGKRLGEGAKIVFNKQVYGQVVRRSADGTFLVKFFCKEKLMSTAAVLRFTDQHGSIPLPPYVHDTQKKSSDYQTVYAKRLGSVAAPTAGFHFTKPLLSKIKKRGVKIIEITLHVGLGTFQPIKTTEIEEHKMHSELVNIGARAGAQILAARQNGQRIIAVGTTTVRALEGWAAAGAPRGGWTKEVNIFIKPGFKFKIVRALITNFHLPKSTLLLLVSALLEQESKRSGQGINTIKKIYAIAIKNNYRFYSFGDAMFIE